MHRRLIAWISVTSVATLLSLTSISFAQSIPKASTELAPNSLTTAWDHLLSYPGLVHSSVSAYAYDLSTGQVLAAIHPRQRETPASVTKLFTSAAALSLLGPHFTYQTTVKATPTTLAQGSGAIYLQGGGDPWLEANGATDLEALAAKVAKVVKRATSVVGVSSLFTAPIYGLGWPYGDLSQNYAAGTTALMAERSEVFVNVTQGGQVGARPAVDLSFNGGLTLPSYFQVVNRATTGPAATADTMVINRRIGTNQIVVSGSIPLSASATPTSSGAVLSIGDPPLFAAALFQQALAEDGVRFASSASVADQVPPTAITLATHSSANLAADLKIQNQYSINQMAENLYRELGVASYGVGSPAHAAAFMQAFSAKAGISPDRVQVDGSGLSPLDETSAEEVVSLLTYVSRQPWYKTFRNSLMHLNDPNHCGILCPPAWSYNLPTDTDLWVKTGNLSNQWNYAGFAKAENGNLIAFAILDDGTPTSDIAYRSSAVDQMMADTAFWPDVPTTPAAGAPPALTSTGPGALLWSKVSEQLPPVSPGSIVGASIVNVKSGKTVWQDNGNILMDSGLLPRLILADAALAYHPSPPNSATVAETGSVHATVLSGDLVLDGHDDSALTFSNLAAMAERVRASGISTVDGDLEYINAITGFHASRWPSGMAWNDFGKGWTPPSSTLIANDDQAEIAISAGKIGQAARVTVMPSLTPIRVQNLTATTDGGANTVTARLKFASHVYVLTGSLPKGSSVTLTIAPPDPGLYAARVFLKDLRAYGVTVKGTIADISTPLPMAKVIAVTQGPTLADQVNAMLATANIAPSEDVASALGVNLWSDIARVLGSEPKDLVEPTGAAMGNYLTPTGISAVLTQAWNNPEEEPLTRLLSQSLWKTESPEEDALAGYIKSSTGAVYAVAVMISEQLWNRHFTAKVLS